MRLYLQKEPERKREREGEKVSHIPYASISMHASIRFPFNQSAILSMIWSKLLKDVQDGTSSTFGEALNEVKILGTTSCGRNPHVQLELHHDKHVSK